MGSPPADLPDPLDLEADHPPRATEDLLSQLAGDQIDRLMSGMPRRSDTASAAPSGPVQQLTDQLDTFFEELRQREGQPIPSPQRQPDPMEADDLSPTQEELASLHGAASPPPRSLFPPRVALPSQRSYPTPLNWLSDPVAALTPGARLAIGVTAIVSFLAGCAALTYVLVLREA